MSIFVWEVEGGGAKCRGFVESFQFLVSLVCISSFGLDGGSGVLDWN